MDVKELLMKQRIGTTIMVLASLRWCSVVANRNEWKPLEVKSKQSQTCVSSIFRANSASYIKYENRSPCAQINTKSFILVVSIEKLLRNHGKRNAWPALTFFVCVAHVLVCTVATQVLQYSPKPQKVSSSCSRFESLGRTRNKLFYNKTSKHGNKKSNDRVGISYTGGIWSGEGANCVATWRPWSHLPQS